MTLRKNGRQIIRNRWQEVNRVPDRCLKIALYLDPRVMHYCLLIRPFHPYWLSLLANFLSFVEISYLLNHEPAHLLIKVNNFVWLFSWTSSYQNDSISLLIKDTSSILSSHWTTHVKEFNKKLLLLACIFLILM